MAFVDIVIEIVGDADREEDEKEEDGGRGRTICSPGYKWKDFPGYKMGACVDPNGKVSSNEPICPSGMTWVVVVPGYGNCEPIEPNKKSSVNMSDTNKD